MILVSDSAAQQIQNLVKQEAKEGAFLRVQVRQGGCSGLSYKLDFQTEVKEGDHVFENKGVKLVVDAKSYMFIAGLTLDFSGGLNGTGFSFTNPNAKKTCGCGSSFAV
jgi:iron-sulfur cluster assembly protein